jgi:hypothetical protein
MEYNDTPGQRRKIFTSHKHIMPGYVRCDESGAFISTRKDNTNILEAKLIKLEAQQAELLAKFSAFMNKGE